MAPGNKIDPIQAVKTQYAAMNPLQQQTMLKELGITNINMLDYSSAKSYCESHNIQGDLAENSAWVKYNQAKTDWNNYHDAYLAANENYKNLHAAENTARTDYNKALEKAVAENDGQKLTSTQDAAIRRETGYTTETIKNASDAEIAANLLLDKCYTAVSNQRTGLAYGILAEGYMDFSA